VAFVLTGGAAKGAYGAGALKALAAAGVMPELIIGSSSGALNGAFCAAYVAADRFDPARVEAEMAYLWSKQSSAWHMLRLRPWLGLTSLASQDFIADVLDRHLAPLLTQVAKKGVRRHVTLLISVSDLRGCPCRIEATPRPIHALQFAHYNQFAFGPPAGVPPFERLRQTLLASTALPFIFAPVEMEADCHPPGEPPQQVSAFTDGGLIDNAPTAQVLRHAGITDVVVVSPHPFRRYEGPLAHLPDMLFRMLDIFQYRNLLNDLQAIEHLNAKKRQVEAFCREQGVAPTDALCRLAGFDSRAQYDAHKEIRLHVVAPAVPLPGHALSGFFHADLRETYVRQGYEDGLRYLVEHWLGAAPVPRHDGQPAA
jgi:predicted acylesterase/phospholipase RssA